MMNFIKLNTVLLFVVALMWMPLTAHGAVSITCYCTDNDGDGYGNPASSDCTYEELDCTDSPIDDPAACATDTCISCGAPQCASCAKCIHPGASEICDGLDNNCNDIIDEDPAASASCDNSVFCDGAEVCEASSCQPGSDPCNDGSACSDDSCDEEADTCDNLCLATGWEDPCCSDPACSGDPICQKEPVCGDGVIDPGEICGEPGLEEGCPVDAPLCLDCVDCGIPVELIYFQTIPGSDAVTLVWETAAEIDTAGFNILRSESQDGAFDKINDVLIPGEGGPTQGAAYSYIDGGLQSGATYWYQLEDVDVTGESYIYDVTVSVTLTQGMCSGASEAQASAIRGTTGESAKPLNSIALFLVPIGALLILRRRLKK